MQHSLKRAAVFDDELSQAVEEYRRGLTPIPNFSEAARRLLRTSPEIVSRLSSRQPSEAA
jgi:hypothetical protein